MINRYSIIKSWENYKSLNLILELKPGRNINRVSQIKSEMQRKAWKSLLLRFKNVQGVQGTTSLSGTRGKKFKGGKGQKVQGVQGARSLKVYKGQEDQGARWFRGLL